MIGKMNAFREIVKMFLIDGDSNGWMTVLSVKLNGNVPPIPLYQKLIELKGMNLLITYVCK